jgi:hypothetical protein
MGCCDSKEMPNPLRLKEEDEMFETKRKEFSNKHASMHIKHSNREIRNSTLPHDVANDDGTTRKTFNQSRTPSGKIRRAVASTALPWKSTVLTVFGLGKVTAIARKVDGIAEVTLSSWELAYGSKVKIYAPSFVLKKHHRNLSSGVSLGSFKTNDPL